MDAFKSLPQSISQCHRLVRSIVKLQAAIREQRELGWPNKRGDKPVVPHASVASLVTRVMKTTDINKNSATEGRTEGSAKEQSTTTKPIGESVSINVSRRFTAFAKRRSTINKAAMKARY